MRHELLTLLALAGLVAGLSGCSTADSAPAPHAEAPNPSAAAEATLHLLCRVADWQYANPSKHPVTDWTSGAYYSGLTRLAQIAPDSRYLDRIRAAGDGAGWNLGPRARFFADDDAIGQTWVDLYRIDGRPEQLETTLAVMKDFLTRPDADGPMRHIPANYTRRWTWCDSLFMAPPLLAKLGALTKDPAWDAALLREYRRTYDHLFDEGESLFARDDSYIPKREANGKKMFWSRGNGWVFAGLVNILRELPADASSRPFFENLFKRMAVRLAALQQADGSWHASLLDPASYPVAETSGTGFFVYGFAYGLNTGLLPEALARPVVDKGWARLASCVHPDGKLGFVQPIGEDPRHVTRDMTENYGVGGFLLAGTEVWRMQLRDAAGPARGPRVAARVVPERFDDFSFENDLIAGRLYSQRLKDKVPPVGAVDVWSKNTAELVTAGWFASGDYHRDHGRGGDFYSCHGGLGAGGLGYRLSDGTLVPSPSYDKAVVLHRGDDAVVFELVYPEISVGRAFVTETRRGTLRAGARYVDFASRFKVRGDAAGVQVVAALSVRPDSQTAEASGLLIQWDKADGADNGFVGVAVKTAPGAATHREAHHRLIEIGTLASGAAWGSGSIWSKSAGAPDFAAWKKIAAAR